MEVNNPLFVIGFKDTVLENKQELIKFAQILDVVKGYKTDNNFNISYDIIIEDNKSNQNKK